MDQYCVVLCGLHAGAADEAAAWQPVAAALKLDQAEFERRVVAVLPRIVRQGLDQATAGRIAQVLQALQVDARVLPDDPQLAYIERAGTSCGPLPQSSLGDFIQPGESYRLRGDKTWRSWPEPADPDSATAAVGFADVDGATSSALTDDEAVFDVSPVWPAGVAGETREPLAHEPPIEMDDAPERTTPAAPFTDAADQRNDIAQEAVAADDELPPAMPPPLHGSPVAEPLPTTAFASDAAAAAPEPDSAASTQDDELEPARETLSSDALEASDPVTPEVAVAPAPERSRIGRLVILVVLVALAVWAYRHLTASTREAAPSAAVSATQPAVAEPGQSTPKTPVAPGVAPAPPLASPASAGMATPKPAVATSASAPATTSSTPAATATAAISSSPTLPANAGTVISARSVLAAAAANAVPATSAH